MPVTGSEGITWGGRRSILASPEVARLSRPDRAGIRWPARSSQVSYAPLSRVDPTTLQVGDIVLCKVNGREYLHLVKAIHGPRFQIGNNRRRINGWVSAGAIFGRCVRVES